jgi:hypothetical protein
MKRLALVSSLYTSVSVGPGLVKGLVKTRAKGGQTGWKADKTTGSIRPTHIVLLNFRTGRLKLIDRWGRRTGRGFIAVRGSRRRPEKRKEKQEPGRAGCPAVPAWGGWRGDNWSQIPVIVRETRTSGDEDGNNWAGLPIICGGCLKHLFSDLQHV